MTNDQLDELERMEAQGDGTRFVDAVLAARLLHHRKDLISLARIGLEKQAELAHLRKIEAEQNAAIGRLQQKWESLLEVVKLFYFTYEVAADRCRKTPGPCFCGCHTSETMQALAGEGEKS